MKMSLLHLSTFLAVFVYKLAVDGQLDNVTQYQQSEFMNITNVQVQVIESNAALLSLNYTRVSNTTNYNIITLQWEKIGGSRETFNNLQSLSISNCIAHRNFSDNEWSCKFPLEKLNPYTAYCVTFEAFEERNSKSKITKLFNTTTTIPKMETENRKRIQFVISKSKTNSIDVIISKDLFSNKEGNITFYGIFIATEDLKEMKNRSKNSDDDQWPPGINEEKNNTALILHYIQTRLDEWSSNEETIVVGPTSCDKNEKNYCNQNLNHRYTIGNKYWYKIRAFTDSVYQDSGYEVFTLSDPHPNDPNRTIFIIGAGIVLLVIVVAGLLWKVCRRIESISIVGCHRQNS